MMFNQLYKIMTEESVFKAPDKDDPRVKDIEAEEEFRKKFAKQDAFVNDCDAFAGDASVVKLEKHWRLGADVNGYNRYGDTPLTAAALSNNVKAVQWLLDHNADPNKLTNTDNANRSPVGLASSDKIRQIIMKAGGRDPYGRYSQMEGILRVFGGLNV